MVDVVITGETCGNTSVRPNAIVNVFIDSKKLALSAKKCSKIHLGNKESFSRCPELKVHKENMKESDKEKYLGDYLNKHANSKDTFKEERWNKVAADKRAIIQDIPLGKRKTEKGLWQA